MDLETADGPAPLDGKIKNKTETDYVPRSCLAKNNLRTFLEEYEHFIEVLERSADQSDSNEACKLPVKKSLRKKMCTSPRVTAKGKHSRKRKVVVEDQPDDVTEVGTSDGQNQTSSPVIAALVKNEGAEVIDVVDESAQPKMVHSNVVSQKCKKVLLSRQAQKLALPAKPVPEPNAPKQENVKCLSDDIKQNKIKLICVTNERPLRHADVANLLNAVTTKESPTVINVTTERPITKHFMLNELNSNPSEELTKFLKDTFKVDQKPEVKSGRNTNVPQEENVTFGSAPRRTYSQMPVKTPPNVVGLMSSRQGNETPIRQIFTRSLSLGSPTTQQQVASTEGQAAVTPEGCNVYHLYTNAASPIISRTGVARQHAFQLQRPTTFLTLPYPDDGQASNNAANLSLQSVPMQQELLTTNIIIQGQDVSSSQLQNTVTLPQQLVQQPVPYTMSVPAHRDQFLDAFAGPGVLVAPPNYGPRVAFYEPQDQILVHQPGAGQVMTQTTHVLHYFFQQHAPSQDAMVTAPLENTEN